MHVCLFVKERLPMTSLLVHTALYMHRQWESQECCIFATIVYSRIFEYTTFCTYIREAPHQLGVGVARSATPTASIYIYGGALRTPKPPRARKSLRAILVTRHCSCVPVSHL